MICKCRGCFRRIPDNTEFCVPCTATDLLLAYHGPGGSHGYDAQLDSLQLDAIHTLLEVLESYDLWHMTDAHMGQALHTFYRAFREG